MPLFISSFKGDDMTEQLKKAEPVYQRPTVNKPRGLIIALVVMLLLILGWEMWVRSEWVTPSYRNSDGLWAQHRRLIDNTDAGKGWVFIGSSRVLFDLQIDVWEELDGKKPLQLALEGTAPVSIMEDLAEDEDFTGQLIVGVAPGLFFSGFEARRSALKRYKKETPTQWFGQQISMLIEPWFAFYDDDYGLSTLLKRQNWPKRDGVRSRIAVRKLSNMRHDRNNRMWDRVYQDPEYNELAKTIWSQGWQPLAERSKERQERTLKNREKQLNRAVIAAKKLIAKGAQVIFVQMPYDGHYAKSENDIAPRDQTWDKLIEQSGAIGIHFQDHPEMQGYDLPEWSHMTGEEADRFTAEFYGLVQRFIK